MNTNQCDPSKIITEPSILLLNAKRDTSRSVRHPYKRNCLTSSWNPSQRQLKSSAVTRIANKVSVNEV